MLPGGMGAGAAEDEVETGGPEAATERGIGQEAGDGVKALGMAGGENCNQIWHRCEERVVGGDEEGLFPFHRAAADEDGSAGRQVVTEELEDGRGRGWREIELEIAGELDAVRRGADGGESCRILRRLGEEEGDGRKHAAPEEAEAQVARQGAIGDAGIHNGNWN